MCGRVNDFTHDEFDFPIELYATIGHDANLYLNELVDTFKLKKISLEPGKVGIWNGNEFVFKETNYIMTMINGLIRYGFTPYYMEKFIDDIIENKWLNHYRIEGSFSSIEDLLKNRMKGLDALTKIDFYSYFTNLGYNKNYLIEVNGGEIRWNYNQEVDSIHALGGIIGSAGSGSKIWKIKGGAKQLCENMVKSAQVNVKLSSEVTEINLKYALYDDDGLDDINYEPTLISSKYEVISKNESTTYDAVILATPLSLSNIKTNIPLPDDSVRYKIVHITIVKGVLRRSYFKVSNYEDLPEYIITSSNSSTPFFNIGILTQNMTKKDGKQYRLMKLFSAQRLEDDTLERIFEDITFIRRENVFAYPYLVPTSIFPPIMLGPSFYYTNAIEAAASVMETAIMAGRNIAYIFAENIKSKRL